METLQNNSAFPEIQSSHNPDRQVDEIWSVGGLSIRAYIATKAMQGLLNKYQGQMVGAKSICETAVEYADCLITELNKK